MGGEGFAAIPTWMMRDERFTGNDLLVYAVLASRAGYQSNHPGQDLIAAEARCSVRTVRNTLKRLEGFGVLERTPRRYASGAKASTGYVLLSGERPSAIAEQPAMVAACDDLPATSDRTYRQIEESIPLIEIDRDEIHTGLEKSELSVDECFAEWWEIYPRKVAVGAARPAYAKAWKKIGAEAARGVLLAGVKRLEAWVVQTRPEARHIPHASTWLNGERWLDEASSMSGAPVLPMTAAEQTLAHLGKRAPVLGLNHDWSANEIAR